MARPTKHAFTICLVLSVVAAAGIVTGLLTGESMYAIVLLAPTVGYEAYRTEGKSTRWASWLLAVLLVAVVVVRIAGFELDLRELVGSDVVRVGDDAVPLGDLTVVFPAAMALLAALLWTRTRGVYTRWLAAVIFVTSAAVTQIVAV